MATSLPPASTYVPFDSATSRTAAVNVAFSALYLLLGSSLCILGRRAWRMSCAIAVGLAFGLLAAAVVLNTLGPTGFKTTYNSTDNDLVAFGIITAAGLLGLLLSRSLPQRWAAGWWLGWAFLGPLAGLSVAFTMMLLRSGSDLLVGNIIGRWILAATFAIIGLATVTMTKWVGATIATSLIGTWLLALGIDLVLNTNTGSSLALRKLLDENSLHQEALRDYYPALSTKLLFSLSWVLAIPFALLQWYINRDRWFLQIQAPEGRRSWKHWFCPFLLRSSRSVPPSSPAEAEKTNNDAFGRDIDDAASKPAGSLHSRQNSTPDTTISIDADLAERGSLASGSDLRALTSNYRRALEILESEDGHQTEDMRETVAVPIQYRPAPLHLENPISSTSKNAQQTSLHQPSSPTRPIMQRSGLNSPVAAYRNAFGRQEQGTDQVPDLGGFRRRADSDRGTSYSIPLTNITSSEYKDRDMFRPPSWTGDLPWHPSMLRGELDPATLPRHPPEEPRPQALPLLDHVVPIHPTSSPQALLEADRSMPPTSQPRFSIERAEDDYELINVEGAASNGKPTLRISQPFQMPYASRPVSREGSPNPLASLGVSGRNIPKAQRTPTRERHLFPSEDDLPDHNPSSPDGATFPALGHSRLHTSETMVDSPRRAGRDEYTTEVDTSGDEAADIASTHASYSMSNFKTRHRILPPKWKGKSVHKQGTPTSESEMDLPARPITQSDLTPHLQDVQLPARPTIVHNENAPVSNAASLTGTPRSSAFKLFGHAPEVPPPMPVLQSGSSEATVRPSQEQRRSMELGELERPIGMPHAEDGSKKVRFFDSGSHRTLRDRFLRRA